MSDEYRQNDPDRAGGLISDAQGEFVQQEPGGVFDPRAFREGTSPGSPPPAPEPSSSEPGDPPVDDERMAAPGEEIDKAR